MSYVLVLVTLLSGRAVLTEEAHPSMGSCDERKAQVIAAASQQVEKVVAVCHATKGGPK